MTQEAGRLSQDLGPLTLERGMDASSSEHEIPPNAPENLFNLDLDRSNRARPRPGSIFFARIGAGNVVGLFEHTFESGIDIGRLTAVVFGPYPVLNNLGSGSDGVGSGQLGFCPDVTVNGQAILPFNGTPTDRFHMVSFLDRVYLAGSTVDHVVREYDYATGVFTALPQAGLSIVAQGNRLFIGGDPDNPSRLFPSDPDDPTVFQPQLAFQIGTRNDGIVALLEHQGMIVVLSERTSSWVLAGDIPAGDVQVEDISVQHGCVGPLAASEAGDGWVYWVSKTDGPVRWRRGAVLDRSFAYRVVELWKTIEKGQDDFRPTVVQWDQVSRCVRFEIPSGDSNVPNYLMSFFVDSGAWTHGANTTDITLGTAIRELDVVEVPMGDDRYTALWSRRDHQDGSDKIYGGDQAGNIWVWVDESVDKIRSNLAEESGTDFTSLIRWGNVEISPLGYRGVIEFLLFDTLAGYEFDFTVWSDQDYAGFQVLAQCVRTLEGGQLTLRLDDGTLLDASRLLNRLFHPIHARVSNWEKLMGKVVRLQVTWTGSRNTMAFSGIEMERSLEAHASAKLQTPPEPGGGPLVLFNDQDGESGSSPTPHAPPTPSASPPLVEKSVTCAWSTPRVTTQSMDSTPIPGDNIAQESTFTGFSSSSVRPGYAAVSADGDNAWFSSLDRNFLTHFDISTIAAPVKSYEYDMEADGAFTGGPPAIRAARGIFYSDVTQRLYVVITHLGGGTSNNHSILIYDVSTPAVAPTLISATAVSELDRIDGIQMSSDELTMYVGLGHNFGGGQTDALASFSVSADGLTVLPLDTIDPFSTGVGVDQKYLQLVSDNLLLMTSESTLHKEFVTIDVSSPSAMAVRDFHQWSGANERPSGIAVNGAGTRAYVKLRSDPLNADQAFAIFDISDPDTISLLATVVLPSTPANAQTGNAIGYVQDSEGDYILVIGTAEMMSFDVSGDVGVLIDNHLTAAQTNAFGLGFPGGPNVFRTMAATTEPPPLTANVLAALFSAGGKGQVAIIDADDLTALVHSGSMQHGDLVDPSATFRDDGLFLVVLGGQSGIMKIYSMTDPIVKVADDISNLAANQLVNNKGLVRNLDSTLVWTGRRGEIHEVDISDPTDPLWVTEVDTGPAHLPKTSLSPVGLIGKLDQQLVTGDAGVGLAGSVDKLIDGYTMPPELYGPRRIVMDATHAFCWNDFNGGGLAVVDHTDATLPVVGYVHIGDMAEVLSIELTASHVYVLDVAGTLKTINVTTPAAPAVVDTTVHDGATDIAVRSTTELIVFGAGSDEASFTVRRINVTVPSVPVQVDQLAATTNIVRGAVANGKAVGVDAGGTAYSYSLGTPPVEEDSIAVGSGPLWKAFGWTTGGDFVGFLLDKSALLSEMLVINVGAVAAITIEGRADTVGKMDSWALDPATREAVMTDQTVPSGVYVTHPVRTADLSTASAPADAGVLSNEELKGAYGLAALGTKAIVGRDLSHSGLVELDISTLAVPALGDSPFPYTWLSPGDAFRVLPARDGTSLFVVSGFPTYRIYAISIAGPRAITNTELGLTSQEVAAVALNDANDRLWVCHRDLGTDDAWSLDVYDVSSPAAIPASLGAYTNFVTGPGAFGDERVVAAKVSGTSKTIACLVMGDATVPRVVVLDFTTEALPTKTGEVNIGATIMHPNAGVGLEIY